MMATQERPDWIHRAAQAVAGLNVIERKEGSAKAHVQEAGALVKTGYEDIEEKIAEVIYRHFSDNKKK